MKHFVQIFLLCSIALSQVNCGVSKIAHYIVLHNIIFSLLELKLFRLYNRNKNFITGNSKDESVSNNEIIVGGEKRLETNDRHVKELLDLHLHRLKTGDGVQFIIDEIQEITRQVVAGIVYRVSSFVIVEGEKKICTISILERNWLNVEKIIISAKCDLNFY